MTYHSNSGRKKYLRWSVVSFLGGLTLLGSQALATAEIIQTVSVEDAGTIDFVVDPSFKTTLFYDKGKMSVKFSADFVQEITTIQNAYDNKFEIRIADYNFDGTNDIAIETGVGYMGVNRFYDIYFYESKSRKFIKRLTEISNFEIKSDSRELLSGTKSGPFYIHRRYRILNNIPYLYQESMQPTPSQLDTIKTFDTSGKLIRTQILTFNGKDEVRVSQDKAFLYDNPDEASKGSAYLIKDDIVKLLKLARGEGEEDWVFVEYKGKKTIRKWLHTADLNVNE